MGPRSCERGNIGRAATKLRMLGMLQWGRAHVSAEIKPFTFDYAPYERASMGPRSCERGNAQPCATLLLRLCSLQWGRAHVRAEIGTEPMVVRVWFDTLQWGRAHVSAEIRYRSFMQECDRRASMGPRSCERGNQAVLGDVTLDVIKLQWGRAHVSAEMSRSFFYVAFAQRASMGPRSCERGNERHRVEAPQGMVGLQWGRAHVSAEIVRPQESYVGRWDRFNGGALM